MAAPSAAPSPAPEAEAPRSPEFEAATRAVAELRDLEAIVEAAVEEAQQEAETAPPAPPPHTAPPEATAAPAPPPVVEPGLVCASCGATICFAADVLAERAVVLKEAVFCYDLDVCGREDALRVTYDCHEVDSFGDWCHLWAYRLLYPFLKLLGVY